jgi:predicted N-acyltransferase
MTDCMDVQIANSVAEIGQEAWDRLGSDQPFASYQWYRFGETVLADDQPVYIVLSRQGEPVARSTFCLKRREQLPISSKITNRFVQAIIRRWPLFVCRSPLASTSGLIMPGPPLRDAALATMAEAAREIGRQHRASFVFYDYVEADNLGLPGWPHGFIPFEIPDPGTFLAIDWPDFDGYQSTLGKSVIKDYRRHHHRAADLGIEIAVHSEVTATDQAIDLIRNVERHHHSPPNLYVRHVLENAGMVDHAWLTAQIGDRLVGCGLLLGDRHTLVLGLLGLDYDVKYVYFQLIYTAIRHAIESGCRTLKGGSGAYETKQRLGFRLERQNHIVLTTDSPVLRRIIHWMSSDDHHAIDLNGQRYPARSAGGKEQGAC